MFLFKENIWLTLVLMFLLTACGGGSDDGGSDGNQWGVSKLIETTDSSNALNPYIVFDDKDNAIVVWDQYDGARSDICTNRFNGENWSNPQFIKTVI